MKLPNSLESVTVTLPSGKVLTMNAASYQKASTFARVVMKCAKGLTNSGDYPIEVLSSQEVAESAMNCLRDNASYDGKGFSEALFDDKEIGIQLRKDYISIINCVIDFHAAPFFGDASSLLKMPTDRSDSETQKA